MSKGARRAVGAMLGLGLVVGLWPGIVSAHDHQPPRAHMLTGSERQRASRGGYSWAERQGRFCSVTIADTGPIAFPDAAGYEIGDRIRFRFRKEQRPRQVVIRQYRDVKKDGTPKGNGRWKFFTLGRVVVNGNVRWEARFDINRPGHHYFHVKGSWRDVDGCGRQNAEWTAHLKARRP